MTVRFSTDNDRERWDRFVMERGDSSCYHLSVWNRVIEKSFGHKTYPLLVEDDSGAVRGILPLVHLKSLLFGNFLVSLPYFNYGGICTDGEENRYLLLRRAIELCKECSSSHVELRHVYPISGLQVKTAKVCMHLPLPATAEELWKSFSAKLRSQIRRPEKEGMYAETGREDQLDSFYSVFADNMRDLGTPVYSVRFFENILRSYPSSWICTVYAAGGMPVASGFLIGFKDTLEIPWASSLRSHNRFSPNMLLYWKAMSFGCEDGYRAFDFGRSSVGGNTYRFKEQWGARPVQLYWHYWMRGGAPMPELNPNNPKYRVAITLWKKLPVNITKLLGPSIVKNLP